jgi:hypothetical protein
MRGIGMDLSRRAGAADILSVTLKRLARAALAAALALASAHALSAQHGGGAAAPAQAEKGNVRVDDLELHLFLSGLRSAQAPRVMDGQLALSASGPYRSVAAAFEHEGFAVLHLFDRNKQGVFVLAYPVPMLREEPLRYRLVVDGAWTSDPANPASIRDPRSGVELSVAEVPRIDDRRLGTYQLLAEDGRTARFLFRGESGRSVTVYGDFDNWDPFIHELAETESGVYTLDLILPEGTHRYAFVYGGEVVPDPLNPRKEKNAEGKIVSVLVVGPSLAAARAGAAR